ncbi:right-handed parallel beta-helix repeat-containing protein [Psychrobacter frigidicola]|uniref:Right-handed parallel beta-helix repeat-containing protein n=1 Tax=Psychrobacter frigidicola TaxID=45611 RepID=A0A5C7A629_9GAMM|nr:right-handed parallel beta-helix repeat-containing protein [Psychrobacter frigidicola]TXD98120.1 right-handed parallel beta-helix repeat-containing protein [Psychrobacter frigidicola]
MGITENPLVKAKPSKQLPITNHLFKDMAHSSVLELDNSQLDMQSSRFIDIEIHAIESIGHSHIKARECTWYVNNMPVLYLHPEGNVEITHSIFEGSNAIICVQEATLVLKSCEFMGINENHPIRVKQNGVLSIIDCVFKDIANFPAIKVESSHLEMLSCRFIDIICNGLHVDGNSHITANNCIWQVTQNRAIVLYPQVTAEITNSVFKGSNASIFTQQAKLTLKSCEFVDISEANPIKATQHSQITIVSCNFNNIKNFHAFYTEDSSRNQIIDSCFNGNALVDRSAEYSKSQTIDEPILDSSRCSEMSEGDLWFLNNDSVEKLHANSEGNDSYEVEEYEENRRTKRDN